jgi:hypothetical integral membrane protein (TIGR02206 family)
MKTDLLFCPFGPDHLAVLGLTLTISVLLAITRKHFVGHLDRWTRRILALGLLLGGGSGWIVAWMHGYLLVPLNLCDLAMLAAIWALVSLQSWACVLVYFWGMGGSLHALLTPDLTMPYPGFWWFQFFGTHAGIVLTAIYLTTTNRVQPTVRSVVWIWLVTNGYMAVVVFINWRYGTNFGYLAEKPAHPSLLDYLGPWPYYLVAIEAIGTLSLLVLYVPFAVARRVRK